MSWSISFVEPVDHATAKAILAERAWHSHLLAVSPRHADAVEESQMAKAADAALVLVDRLSGPQMHVSLSGHGVNSIAVSVAHHETDLGETL